MPIQTFCEPSEKAKEAMNKVLAARYKVYKECRDRGETPTCNDMAEAFTFTLKYQLEKLDRQLRPGVEG